MVLCPFHRSHRGKSALEIGEFLRRNFWMISGGPILSRPLCCTADEVRDETKALGRFRKRAVLANVPSFRFLVPGNIHMYPRSGFFWCRGTSECTLVLVFGTGELECHKWGLRDWGFKQSGKKKAHKHKLFGPVALGTNPLCPRDKPRFSLLFYTMEAGQRQFVPGTILGTKGGQSEDVLRKRLFSSVFLDFPGALRTLQKRANKAGKTKGKKGWGRAARHPFRLKPPLICYTPICGSPTRAHPSNLVALYRAIRLRFGYGFESCDANGPRNVKNINLAKHRPVYLASLLLVGSAYMGAISRCDLCDKLTLRFVCPRSTRETDGIAAKLLRCGIASEALRRNMRLCRQNHPF